MEQMASYHSTVTLQTGGRSLNKVLSIFLLLTGLAVSLYLFYRYQAVVSNSTGKSDVCSTVFGRGCDGALKSNVSEQFGLPLAGWGTIYYTFLLILMIAALGVLRSFHSTARILLLLLSFGGTLVSLTLLCMMIIDPTLFCPFCLALHIINLLLFFSLVRMISLSQEEFFSQSKQEARMIFAKGGRLANSKRIGMTAILLIVALLYVGLRSFSQNAIASGSRFDPQKIVAQYNGSELKKIPVEDDDPVLGNLDSPIEMIVFSDFQCGGCAFFAAGVKELNKRYPGKIHVIYKYFPLGLACNNTIGDDIHPRACEAAWAAEAANQQGKFWEFHDALYTINLNASTKTVCYIADSLGLDHKEFEAYRISTAARQKTAQTVKLAKQLGVMETPAVYINGKLAPDFKFKALEAIVRHNLGMPGK